MEDEDAFLYGDSGAAPASPRLPACALPNFLEICLWAWADQDWAADVKAVINGRTDSKAEPAQGDDEEDGEVAMDEESSDDDIEITLEADPNAPAPPPTAFRHHMPAYIRQPGTAGPSVAQPSAAYEAQKAPNVPVLRPPADVATGATPPAMSLTASGMPRPQVEQPVTLEDGDTLLDVNIDDLPDQPWRKAGAVVSEFFNYGFDEATWKAYCARQKVSREEREQERDEAFSVFVTLPLQEAWDALSMDHKTKLMQTIATSFANAMPDGTDGLAVKQEQNDDMGHASPHSSISALPATVPTGPAATRRPGPERPPIPVRTLSPLPENIPTGPRGARPSAPPVAAPAPTGPAVIPKGPRNQITYRDTDMDGTAGKDDVLDYGNERPERDDISPRSERREKSSRDKRHKDREESVDDEEERKGSRRSRRDSERDREKDKERGDRRSRAERDKSPSGTSKRRSRDDEREEPTSRSTRDKTRGSRSRIEEAFGEESEEETRSSKRTKR